MESSVEAQSRASSLCDLLQQLCDDPTERFAMAQKFRQTLEDEYFSDLFMDELLTVGYDGLLRAVPEVLRALKVAVDPTMPLDVRMQLLLALVPGTRCAFSAHIAGVVLHERCTVTVFTKSAWIDLQEQTSPRKNILLSVFSLHLSVMV